MGETFRDRVIHVEPSSRCTLECPNCPRTNGKGRYAITDCDIPSMVDLCKNFKQVTMCGTHGDPIYHPRLPELITAIHAAIPGIKVGIVTNGAFRTAAWWENLADSLNDNDNITFSIDGMPHNYDIYRKNSEWRTIETGVKVLRKKRPDLWMTWKWVIFSYNEHDITGGMQLAIDMGFNSFIVVSSSRNNGHLNQTRDNADIEMEINRWLQ